MKYLQVCTPKPLYMEVCDIFFSQPIEIFFLFGCFAIRREPITKGFIDCQYTPINSKEVDDILQKYYFKGFMKLVVELVDPIQLSIMVPSD